MRSFPRPALSPIRELEESGDYLFDTGHFGLEEDGDQIADLMRVFLRKNVKR